MPYPMNLYRHPNENYYIRFSRGEMPPNGKLVSIRRIVGYEVKDASKAKEILDSLKKNWHRNKLIQLHRGKRISLKDFRTKYTEDAARSDLSSETLRMDDLALRSLGDAIGRNRDVRAIGAEDLKKFKKACLARKCSPHTVKSYLRHIKAALNYAIENGYRERPPKIPKVKTPRRVPRIIPAEDLNIILKYARKNDFEIWRYAQFSLWTGCRLAGCHRLKWQDLTIYSRAKRKIYGRVRLVEKGDAERFVPLLKGAREALGRPKNIGPVFLQQRKDTVSKKFHAVVVACGLAEKRYNFHSLRHTSATRMVESGIKLEIIQKILGHSDIRTTQIYAEIYDHVVEEEMRKMK